MMRRTLFVALLATLGGLPAQAAEVAAGKALVDGNCQHCHGSDIYVRPNRRVKNLDQLKTQVRRCELSLGLKWSDDEIGNAAAYLNQEFYKFP